MTSRRDVLEEKPERPRSTLTGHRALLLSARLRSLLVREYLEDGKQPRPAWAASCEWLYPRVPVYALARARALVRHRLCGDARRGRPGASRRRG